MNPPVFSQTDKVKLKSNHCEFEPANNRAVEKLESPLIRKQIYTIYAISSVEYKWADTTTRIDTKIYLS